MRRFPAATLVTVASVWAACGIYGPDLLLPPDAGTDAAMAQETSSQDAPPARDAADAAVATDAGADVLDSGCVLAHPPAPPAQDDPSDASDVEIVLAVRTFDLGLRPDGGAPPLIGYDLDGLCTCPGPADCVPVGSGGPNCDEPGGRDNAGGALLRSFYQLSGGGFFSQDTLNAQIAAGLDTLLVRVRQYNGQSNDTQVELSVYVSDGTVPSADGGPPAVPQWDGRDAWIVDGRSVFGANGPPIIPIDFDQHAYVAGGVLVGSIPDYFVPLQIDSSDVMLIELGGGIVSGTLAQSGGHWTLANGVVDGRLAASNLLSEFAYVHDPQDPNAYLCPSSPSYADLKSLICPALDVTSNPSAPHAQTCDGLSMVLGFAAQGAQFGPVQTAARPTTCADGGTDHC